MLPWLRTAPSIALPAIAIPRRVRHHVPRARVRFRAGCRLRGGRPRRPRGDPGRQRLRRNVVASAAYRFAMPGDIGSANSGSVYVEHAGRRGATRAPKQQARRSSASSRTPTQVARFLCARSRGSPLALRHVPSGRRRRRCVRLAARARIHRPPLRRRARGHRVAVQGVRLRGAGAIGEGDDVAPRATALRQRHLHDGERAQRSLQPAHAAAVGWALHAGHLRLRRRPRPAQRPLARTSRSSRSRRTARTARACTSHAIPRATCGASARTAPGRSRRPSTSAKRVRRRPLRAHGNCDFAVTTLNETHDPGMTSWVQQ